jgi:hypothetical protein
LWLIHRELLIHETFSAHQGVEDDDQRGDKKMKTNPLKELGTLGQSIWLDYIRRDLIAGGGLDVSSRRMDYGG